MFCGTPTCDIPIASLLDMENKSNGEVAEIILYVQPAVDITLHQKKIVEITLSL